MEEATMLTDVFKRRVVKFIHHAALYSLELEFSHRMFILQEHRKLLGPV